MFRHQRRTPCGGMNPAIYIHMCDLCVLGVLTEPGRRWAAWLAFVPLFTPLSMAPTASQCGRHLPFAAAACIRYGHCLTARSAPTTVQRGVRRLAGKTWRIRLAESWACRWQGGCVTVDCRSHTVGAVMGLAVGCRVGKCVCMQGAGVENWRLRAVISFAAYGALMYSDGTAVISRVSRVSVREGGAGCLVLVPCSLVARLAPRHASRANSDQVSVCTCPKRRNSVV